MPKCYTCSKTLGGQWSMTDAGPTYAETGRYLGVSDGYFLYGGSANWVYCYCLDCWKKHVLALSFVTAEINTQKASVTTLTAQTTELNNKVSTLTTENASLKAQLDSKSKEYSSLQAQLTTANQTITSL